MKKLSKAQQAVYDQIIYEVRRARSLEYPAWLVETDHFFQIPAWMTDPTSESYNPRAAEYRREKLKKAIADEYMKKYYDDERRGIVLTSCNSRTLEKLQEYGLIEILYDSKGEKCGCAIDRVKLVEA